MTGDITSTQIRDAAARWGTPILLKPFAPEEILDAIDTSVALRNRVPRPQLVPEGTVHSKLTA